MSTRNAHGLKWQIDCYRTVNGETYIAWMSYPSSDRIKAYRASGIRCRRFKDELFIHPDDKAKAISIDKDNP